MKRIFSFLLAIALTLSMAPLAFAATSAQIYEVEDGLCDQLVTDLVPGNTYFISLGAAKPDKTRYSFEIDDSFRVYDDKSITLVSSKTLPVVRKKVSSSPSTYEYFAELKIRSIPSADYHEDGYYLSGSMEYDVNDVDTVLDITANVAYPDGGDDIDETLEFFVFDDEEEIELDILAHDGARLTVDSRGLKTQVLLAMDSDYNSSIGNQYPSADLDFLNGNGASFRRTSQIYIPADSDMFLYEINNGALTDLTSRYDNDEDGFVISTRTFGSYVLSNVRLRASATASSSQAASSGGTVSSTPSSSAPRPVSTAGANLSNIIRTFFKNKFTVINYGETHENIGKTVTLKAKLDLSHLNPSTLRVYAYDAAGYRLLALAGTNARLGSDGYFYFNTPVKGYYVITDAPLA